MASGSDLLSWRERPLFQKEATFHAITAKSWAIIFKNSMASSKKKIYARAYQKPCWRNSSPRFLLFPDPAMSDLLCNHEECPKRDVKHELVIGACLGLNGFHAWLTGSAGPVCTSADRVVTCYIPLTCNAQLSWHIQACSAKRTSSISRAPGASSTLALILGLLILRLRNLALSG